jgi:hypothetical protein
MPETDLTYMLQDMALILSLGEWFPLYLQVLVLHIFSIRLPEVRVGHMTL